MARPQWEAGLTPDLGRAFWVLFVRFGLGLSSTPSACSH